MGVTAARDAGGLEQSHEVGGGMSAPAVESDARAPIAEGSTGDALDLLGLSAIVSDLHKYADDIHESWGTLSGGSREEIQAVVKRLGGIVAHPETDVAAPVKAPPVSNMSQGVFLLGGIALAALWLIVFSLGFSVPVSPHLEAIDAAHQTSLSALAFVRSIVAVIVCSTPTNPGILACIAALLGGIARWIHVDGSSSEESDAAASIQRICFAPMLRGFFMYLALLAGLLLLTTQAITKATLDQYVQLAGTVSVLAFMIGYDPDVFKKLMGKVNGWAIQRENSGVKNPSASLVNRSADLKGGVERN